MGRNLRTARTRSRLSVAAGAGVVATIVTGLVGSWTYAPGVGWDVAALVLNAWIWVVAAPMDSHETDTHARREDPGRKVSDVIIIAASIASLGAIGVILIEAGSANGLRQGLLAGLGVASVALSWLTVHTLFTLRYALLYYGGHDGGINFNQKTPPRYLDFAYLAFTIGMTFQVSDTNLETPVIRATALRHALLSYLFGAVILASTINLLAGLGSNG